MIRAVIDTSILILALIKPRGTVGPALQGLRDAARQLVYSDPLLAEPADVLARPRLAKKYGVTTEDVATVLPPHSPSWQASALGAADRRLP